MSVSKKYELNLETNLKVVFSGTQGPTLIFLHFWGGSSMTYAPIISHLSSQFRCIAVDFRGWGGSSGPQRADAYSMRDLAMDIEALIQQLELDEDLVLVGHSMGGKVAQLVAGRGLVKQLRGLVLIAPAPPTALELPDHMKSVQLTAYSSRESAEFVVKNVLASSKLSDEAVANLVDVMMKGNEFAKAAWPSYGMAEDIVEHSRKINVPVLVIAGELDRIEPLERLRTEVVCNIPAMELVVLESSGHLMPLEAPLGVVQYVKDFLHATF